MQTTLISPHHFSVNNKIQDNKKTLPKSMTMGSVSNPINFGTRKNERLYEDIDNEQFLIQALATNGIDMPEDMIPEERVTDMDLRDLYRKFGWISYFSKGIFAQIVSSVMKSSLDEVAENLTFDVPLDGNLRRPLSAYLLWTLPNQEIAKEYEKSIIKAEEYAFKAIKKGVFFEYLYKLGLKTCVTRNTVIAQYVIERDSTKNNY